MTITLTPEIERALSERAARQGTTPEMLALHDLRGLYLDINEPKGFQDKTLAEVLAGRVGTVDSSERNGGGPSHLSEKTGERFTEHLVEKHRQGRL